MLYITSDEHYWHANVIKYCNRPFSNVEEMNETILKNHNEIVKPEDTVYHLGDFSMAFRAVELYSSKLIGAKKLVPGNHDWLHSYHKKSRTPENQKKWIEKYKEHGWQVLHEQMSIDLGEDVGIVDMCHHPYSDDGSEGNDKYAKWRPQDEGRILLCGHVHERWKTKLSPKGSLMINVGVDQWDFKPVSIDQIIEIIQEFENNGVEDVIY